MPHLADRLRLIHLMLNQLLSDRAGDERCAAGEQEIQGAAESVGSRDVAGVRVAGLLGCEEVGVPITEPICTSRAYWRGRWPGLSSEPVPGRGS